MVSETLCTGCTACKSICPVKAISMIRNKEGFLYPIIDMEKCVGCGLCDKVCPEQSISEKFYPKQVIYAKNKDDLVRINSSSGGMFTAIADFVLKNEGIVYGALYDENFQVVHKGRR